MVRESIPLQADVLHPLQVQRLKVTYIIHFNLNNFISKSQGRNLSWHVSIRFRPANCDWPASLLGVGLKYKWLEINPIEIQK